MREKFIKAFMKRTVPILKKKNKRDAKYIPTKNETILLDLGQPIAEIETCFQVMDLFPKIITSHSSYYEKKGFSRIQQHRKNIEWYFSEVYILKERTVKLLKILKKKLTSAGFDKNSQEVKLVESIIDGFLKSVDGIIIMRGKHTHEFSYQNEDLYHMELLDLAIKEFDYDNKDKEGLRSDMFFYLKMDRERWKKIISDNNEALEQIMGNIYSSIEKDSLIDKSLSKTLRTSGILFSK